MSARTSTEPRSLKRDGRIRRTSMSEVNSTHQVRVSIFNLIDFFAMFTARNTCIILELKRKEKNTSKTKVKRKYVSKCTTPKHMRELKKEVLNILQ